MTRSIAHGLAIVWLTGSLLGCAASPLARLDGEVPAVEITMPKENLPAAPIWEPALASDQSASRAPGGAGASAGEATKPPVDARVEFRATVEELAAAGHIEPDAQREILATVDQTDPATLAQLTWLYRQSMRRRDTPKQDTSTQVAPEKFDDPPASTPLQLKQPQNEHAAAASPVPEPAPSPEPSTSPQPRAPSSEPQPPSPAPSASEPRPWNEHLAQTIAALETQASTAEGEASRRRAQALLRMLYLAADRREDALRPVEGLSSLEQSFWADELYGLSMLLDETRLPDPARRQSEATRHLRQAMQHLAESSPLVVKQLAFCSEVTSFGVYTSFPKLEFKPGQQLLLYAEVENFKSDDTSKGFHTALRSRYLILDPQGHKLDEHEFPVAEEWCQNARRDYFVRYFITLPQRIYDGRHTLQLTIEDTLGRKVGQGQIEFTVKTK